MYLSACYRSSLPQAQRDAQSYRRPSCRYRSTVLASVLVLLIGWSAAPSAFAETKQSRPAQQKKINDSALMLLSGRPGTSYFTMARDIAAAIGETEELRLLAVDGAGGADNIRDLLFLRGIDLALVPANVLAHPSTAASFGPNLPQRLNFVVQLYSEEIHILAGRAIASLEDLRGKKIAIPRHDANAEFSVNDLLQRLGIEAEVVAMAVPDAIDEVRSGAVAALVLMGGKPLRTVASLPKDGSLRLLPLRHAEGLADAYSPAAFRSSDYPSLVADGQTIDTVSVSAVLVANNMAKADDAYRRVSRFIPAFFSALSELAGPQWHPKWSEVNLATDVTGLPRFAAAREWLVRIRRQQAAAMQKGFEEFLSTTGGPGLATMSPAQRRELFEEFVKWSRKSVGTPQPRP
jgi:TRAP transporter TAXI family solute receptor